MRFIVLILITLSLQLSIAQELLPNVINGKIERLENFESKYVTPRHVDIYLPKNYSDNEKYSVLYMHDGQMLYDAKTTWNKQAWDVDDVVDSLITAGQIHDVIVVGVHNGGETRHPDYFPQKPLQELTQMEIDTLNAQLRNIGRVEDRFIPNSDNYLKFLVEELKPHIDKNYSVYTDKEHTFVMGSSMGGLISMYAICEYPEVFGGAACLSTHWPGTFTMVNNPIPLAFINYLKDHLPNPKSHKIYFDCGDQTLDAFYPPIQKKVDVVMEEKGFASENWMTQYFSGENHSEIAWNKRLHIPIRFLLQR